MTLYLPAFLSHATLCICHNCSAVRLCLLYCLPRHVGMLW